VKIILLATFAYLFTLPAPFADRQVLAGLTLCTLRFILFIYSVSVLSMFIKSLNFLQINFSIMKKNGSIFIAMWLLFVNSGIAQTTHDTLSGQAQPADSTMTPAEDFKSVLLGTYLSFDTARSIEELYSAGNRFTLIANKWSDQWAAQYYACFTQTTLSYIEKDAAKRDAFIDAAERFFGKAQELNKTEYDEFYVMAAMMASARLSVKPGSRYKKYGDLFTSNIEKAKTINPDNPRAYYLEGTNVFYTPKMFGGGPKKALPYFEKADTLFQKQKEDDIFKPFWGKKRNTEFLKQCREAVK
jgi:hypothetical protein